MCCSASCSRRHLLNDVKLWSARLCSDALDRRISSQRARALAKQRGAREAALCCARRFAFSSFVARTLYAGATFDWSPSEKTAQSRRTAGLGVSAGRPRLQVVNDELDTASNFFRHVEFFRENRALMRVLDAGFCHAQDSTLVQGQLNLANSG